MPNDDPALDIERPPPPLEGAEDPIDEGSINLPGAGGTTLNSRHRPAVLKIAREDRAKLIWRYSTIVIVLGLVIFTTGFTIFFVWEAIELDANNVPKENRVVGPGVLAALIAGSVAEVGLALRYIAKNLFPND